MNLNDLKKILIDSLDDLKLNQDEKYEFKVLSETLDDEQFRYLKNKAFELCRPHIEKGGVDAINALNWLERVIKAVQPINKTIAIRPSAYFSPGDDCRNKIISLMDNARHKIEICVFTISDNPITRSILAAHQRGVDVTIISDNDKANDKGSDVDYLAKKGIEVMFDNSPNHMHHKFAIFDGQLLLNGSFNWTRSASTVNEENIIVTSEKELVRDFGEQFSDLYNKFS